MEELYKEPLSVTKNTFHLVSLGCAKNTVDSDSMAQLLIGSGYRQAAEASTARVIIVNTCGFIGPAKEESISVLKELASQKKHGQILIAAGCLTQRCEINRILPVVMPLHPRTRSNIEKFGLTAKLDALRILPPVGFSICLD